MQRLAILVFVGACFLISLATLAANSDERGWKSDNETSVYIGPTIEAPVYVNEKDASHNESKKRCAENNKDCKDR